METVKIYNEDCLITMKRMPDNFVDFVITSPPYDDIRNYNGYQFEFEKIAKELFRVLKVGGVVIWVVADSTIDGSETGTSFKQALFFKEIGFRIHDTMIYYKNNPIRYKYYRHGSGRDHYLKKIWGDEPLNLNSIKETAFTWI